MEFLNSFPLGTLREVSGNCESGTVDQADSSHRVVHDFLEGGKISDHNAKNGGRANAGHLWKMIIVWRVYQLTFFFPTMMQSSQIKTLS